MKLSEGRSVHVMEINISFEFDHTS